MSESEPGIGQSPHQTSASDESPIKTSAKRAITEREDRRHSREDALTDREFETLLRAIHKMKDGQELEARTALFLAGKLGLRGGAIAHLDESWINWQDSVIEIPEHDTCTKGVNPDEVCGYCRRRAVDELNTNNLTVNEAIRAIRHEYDSDRLAEMADEDVREAALDIRREVNITYQEAISRRWKPKTPQSARRIPFDFDVRVEMCIERFFEQYDAWEKSKSTLNRRIERLSEVVDEDIRVYPHALRATAASAQAKRGVSAYSLMSIMGWSDISTARTYILSNEDRAATEIRSVNR